jgi:hypothetical protein
MYKLMVLTCLLMQSKQGLSQASYYVATQCHLNGPISNFSFNIKYPEDETKGFENVRNSLFDLQIGKVNNDWTKFISLSLFSNRFRAFNANSDSSWPGTRTIRQTGHLEVYKLGFGVGKQIKLNALRTLHTVSLGATYSPGNRYILSIIDYNKSDSSIDLSSYNTFTDPRTIGVYTCFENSFCFDISKKISLGITLKTLISLNRINGSVYVKQLRDNTPPTFDQEYKVKSTSISTELLPAIRFQYSLRNN